jgi:hypothetical protein
MTFGETGERLSAAGIIAGPSVTLERMHEVGRLVRLRPIDFYAPVGSTGVRGLTRYVLECTRPADRILAGSFEPQIFFYAERAFAGGQVFLKNGWNSSREDQQRTVARLQGQRVPIVLFSAATETAIRQAFPLVYGYVEEQYQPAGRSDFGGDSEYVVFVKRGLQSRGTYAPLNLPCYR